MKTTKTKENKGVTLIAIVVTVVVLLILAGIAVNTLTGDNAIIINTSKAKFRTDVKDIEEQLQLNQIKEEEIDSEFGTLDNLIGRTDEYNEILRIEEGKLVYDSAKTTEEQATWLEELGISAKLDIIPIYTKEQLEKIATGENIKIEQAGGTEFTFLPSSHYKLQNDINISCNEERPWTGISNFTGTFEGNNYLISGIYGNTGLFNSNGGTIQNLKVEGTIEVISDYIGGIANRNLLGARIINCENRIEIKDIDDNKNYNFCGGISATNQGEIYNCTNNAYLLFTSISGGIVGSNEEKGIVKRCANLHEILLKDFSIGGIAGINNSTVEECYNNGEILASTTYSRYGKGGIVGRNYGTIRKCYNLKNINGYYSNWNLGGIAGDNQASGTIYYCYNVGQVNATSTAKGGIVGESKGKITNCYTLDNMEIIGANTGELNNCLKLTEQQIKNQEKITLEDESEAFLINLLNMEEEIFVEDTMEINNGYLILK